MYVCIDTEPIVIPGGPQSPVGGVTARVPGCDAAAFVRLQIGAFFMINLCLVVIATQFSETKRRETERMLEERKRFHSTSTLASISEPGGCYDEIIKYIGHLWRRGRRRLKRWVRQRRRRRQPAHGTLVAERAISLRRRRPRRAGAPTVQLQRTYRPHSHHHHRVGGSISNKESAGCAPRASPEPSDVDPAASPRRPSHLGLDVPPAESPLHTPAASPPPPPDAAAPAAPVGPRTPAPLLVTPNRTLVVASPGLLVSRRLSTDTSGGWSTRNLTRLNDPNRAF